MGRIKDLVAATGLRASETTIVDNPTDGTRRIPAVFAVSAAWSSELLLGDPPVANEEKRLALVPDTLVRVALGTYEVTFPAGSFEPSGVIVMGSLRTENSSAPHAKFLTLSDKIRIQTLDANFSLTDSNATYNIMLLKLFDNTVI